MNSTVLTAPTPRAVVSRPIQTAGAKFTQQAVYVYLVIQFVSQSALMIEDLGSYRTVLRALGYASSLFLLVLFSGLPERRSPLRAVAIAFLAVVCL